MSRDRARVGQSPTGSLRIAASALGWLAADVCQGLNDIDLDAPDDAAYELGPRRADALVEEKTSRRAVELHGKS